MTVLEEVETTEPVTDEGKDLAHIINPPMNTHIWFPGMMTETIVEIARKRQIEVIALCGYKFVPKQDPDVLDACPECIRIAGELMRENGE